MQRTKGMPSRANSETERTASSPNQFMNQFASSPANVKGCPSWAVLYTLPQVAKKEKPKGGMGGRHDATTQGF